MRYSTHFTFSRVAAVASALFFVPSPIAASGPSLWTYATVGSDDFSLGAAGARTSVGYRGRQTLAIERHGTHVRYRARVTYLRSEGLARERATASYVSDVATSGTLLSSSDRDPDYLTVLDQPFAAQLDAPTLADLRDLRGTLPFDFPSPYTGSSLHGYLEHVAAGPIANRASIGVRFEAAGRMRGALPDRPGASLDGKIAMRGTAYYDRRFAVLLVLETTVTISGTVSTGAANDPVTIVYARSIRFVR